MPASVADRKQYTKVVCPNCKTSYKVSVEEADAFAASLPAACECSKPQPVVADPALVIQNADNMLRLHDARLKLLEDGLLKVRGDLAALMVALEAAINKPALAPTADASGPTRPTD